MATLELEVQRRIVADCNKLPNGYAMKMSNMYLAGVPDLMLSLLGSGMVMVEVKKINTINQAIAMTGLQRDKLRKIQMSGINAGWLAYRQTVDMYDLYIGNNPDAKYVTEKGVITLIKSKGRSWPVKEIIEAVRQSVA